MREIKCRAWYPFEGRFIKGKDIQNKSIPIRNTRYGFSLKTRFILQQSTGLKDKNGHEIYEGDIIYLAGYGDYVVEWPFIQLFESSFEGDIGGIIGNIYENPEL